MINKYLWIIIISCIFCGACFTINYSTKGASIPPEAKTFSVQYIQNQASIVEPGLSELATSSFKQYIQKNSKLIMVNNNADINFEAFITGYEPSTPATVVAGDRAAQNKFTIALKVRFTCNVKPELDFESTFSRYVLYNANANFESLKSDLTDDLLELIFEDIYKKAFVNW